MWPGRQGEVEVRFLWPAGLALGGSGRQVTLPDSGGSGTCCGLHLHAIE